MSDIVMWLLKKARQDEHLPYNCAMLVRYAAKYSYAVDLSFEAVSRQMSAHYDELMQMEMTEEKIAAAQELLALGEENRQRGMRELEAEKAAKAG